MRQNKTIRSKDQGLFKDRVYAGKQLAKTLEKYKNKDGVIFGLPRGGVVVAFEVAQSLNMLLDLIVVRKISHPYSREYAYGAVAEDGHTLYNKDELPFIDVSWFHKEREKEQKEAKRRRETYLSGRRPISVEGKIAIVVDDGIATGLTMKMAVKELKHQNPQKIIIAVPVAPKDIADEMRKDVDEFIALTEPKDYLGSVGAYYQEFLIVEDKTVIQLMQSISPKKSQKDIREAKLPKA